MNILGIDPSLSNFGFAKVCYGVQKPPFDCPTIDQLLLSETAPKDKKIKHIRQNVWDLSRCGCHYDYLQEMLHGVDCVMVELPVGSQSARAMASYGTVLGVISSIRHIPVFVVTPEQVKQAATGNKEASKKDMIKWAVDKYGEVHFLKSRQDTILNKNEHLADALAAIEAGLKLPEFNEWVMSRRVAA